MKPLIVRIFTNFTVTNTSELLGRSEEEFRSEGIELFFNRSGRADLVLVLNSVTSPRWVSVPSGRLIKILQEPIVRNPLTHLFTYRHSRIFDEVLTHTPDPEDPRQVKSIPFLGSFVDPTTLTEQPFGRKNKMVSVIASTLAFLPGHKLRSEFIENLLCSFPELEPHLFGRGRKKELEKKVEGLENYRFSVAIENSVSPSYITEKFYDCIIAGCVPLYFGAPDIGDYFPKESYITFPIDDFERCSEIIQDLSVSDFEGRMPALVEARALIREKYSIGSVILKYLTTSAESSPSSRKMLFLLRFDGLICMVQKMGITKIPKRLYLKIKN
jgi:hypothetical protein